MIVNTIFLCMKKKGVRFFTRMKFNNINIVKFHKKDNFMGLLRNRIDCFDNVLITAHGNENGILTTSRNLGEPPYQIFISENETEVFKNNFVFAVSCFTARCFGQRCVENGTIAYLGYDAGIGKLFCYSKHDKKHDNIPNRITRSVDNIVKRIFIEELANSYELFFERPISVQFLKEYFSYRLEKRLAELEQMCSQEVFEKFKTNIPERDYKKYVPIIILNILVYLNTVYDSLICIGDSNYISSGFIFTRKSEGKTVEEIMIELEDNEFFKLLRHEEYKRKLRELVKNA